MTGPCIDLDYLQILQLETRGIEAMASLRAMTCCHREAAIVLMMTALLSGCASAPVDKVELMPAPDVYGDGLLNPLPDTNPFDRIQYDGILIATDRSPATKEDPEKY